MKQRKTYKLSYPDSIKILKESLKKDQAIRLIEEQLLDATHEQILKAVNKCVIENAERLGTSVYNICFRTVPQVGYGGSDSMDITLVPVEFDLTHDGGYWKGKYYSLLKKVQSVIDNETTEDNTPSDND